MFEISAAEFIELPFFSFQLQSDGTKNERNNTGRLEARGGGSNSIELLVHIEPCKFTFDSYYLN